MKHNYTYTIIFLVAFLTLTTSQIIAQGQWIPKIGIDMPLSSPTMFDIQVDAKTGVTIGAEYKIGGEKIFFTPSLMYVRNKVDVFRIDTITGTQAPLLIDDSSIGILQATIGGEAILAQFNETSSLRLRSAFVLGFNMASPNWETYGLREDAQRQMNWEFLFGFGLDFSKIVIDIDGNLSLLKEFRDSDIVKNGVSLTVGYKL